MFKNFFNKKITIKSPIDGEIVDLSKVPDKVFSDKIIGDGFAIQPTSGILYSPVEGTILKVFPTKHAICINTKEGVELLIHIGIDTVKMNEECFNCFVNEGDNIKYMSKIMEFDLEKISFKCKSNIIPIIITNIEMIKNIEVNYGNCRAGDIVANIYIK